MPELILQYLLDYGHAPALAMVAGLGLWWLEKRLGAITNEIRELIRDEPRTKRAQNGMGERVTAVETKQDMFIEQVRQGFKDVRDDIKRLEGN